jgi:FtsH-binding integral membrane protein
MKSHSMVRSTAFALGLALALFIAAATWGAMFAFPEPDASAEDAARMKVHASIAGWAMVASLFIGLAALARLLRHWVRNHSEHVEK